MNPPAQVSLKQAMDYLASAVRGSGLSPVLEETGATLIDLSEPHDFETPDHRVARRITLAKALQDIDVVISLPKLKTHAQMILTGALKNHRRALYPVRDLCGRLSHLSTRHPPQE